MRSESLRVLRRSRFLSRDTEINVVSLIDIFAILVFYLLVNALVVEVIPRYQNLVLPKAALLNNAEDKLVLAVSRDSIFVNDQQIMERKDAALISSQTIEPLVLALRKAKAVKEQLIVTPEEQGIGINIVADQDIPYALLKRILASCSEAGLSQVLLTVEKKSRVS